MRNRRLWMVNQYAAPKSMPSAARHIELATILADYGWETWIFASRNKRTAAETGTGGDVCEAKSIGPRFVWVYSVPFSGKGIFRYLNMVSFFVTAMNAQLQRPKPDVIIGSSPNLLAALSALVAAKVRRAPFVLEVRDMWPDSLVQLGLNNRAVIWPLMRIESLLYRSSIHIIALTDGIRDSIIAKGVEPAKVSLIPNAALRPEPLNPAAREQTRRDFGWEEKTVVIWPGIHNHANGLEFVVDAALRLRDRDDILFVFIGRGEDKAALMKRAGGASNIQFWDPVPKKDIARIVRAADIGILNSRAFDAFRGARPNKLFEYMANGVAIVNSIPGEAAQLVAEAGGGIQVQWENPSSIADGITSLAKDPKKREEMGRSGHQYVGAFHSRERTAEALHQLLSEIVTRRPGS